MAEDTSWISQGNYAVADIQKSQVWATFHKQYMLIISKRYDCTELLLLHCLLSRMTGHVWGTQIVQLLKVISRLLYSSITPVCKSISCYSLFLSPVPFTLHPSLPAPSPPCPYGFRAPSRHSPKWLLHSQLHFFS